MTDEKSTNSERNYRALELELVPRGVTSDATTLLARLRAGERVRDPSDIPARLQQA